MYSEKQRYDGYFNNLAHPTWGTIGNELTWILLFFALVGTFTDNIRYLMISAKIARFRNRASKTSNKLMLLNNWRENPFLFWVAHSRGGGGGR